MQFRTDRSLRSLFSYFLCLTDSFFFNLRSLYPPLVSSLLGFFDTRAFTVLGNRTVLPFMGTEWECFGRDEHRASSVLSVASICCFIARNRGAAVVFRLLFRMLSRHRSVPSVSEIGTILLRDRSLFIRFVRRFFFVGKYLYPSLFLLCFDV